MNSRRKYGQSRSQSSESHREPRKLCWPRVLVGSVELKRSRSWEWREQGRNTTRPRQSVYSGAREEEKGLDDRLIYKHKRHGWRRVIFSRASLRCIIYWIMVRTDWGSLAIGTPLPSKFWPSCGSSRKVWAMSFQSSRRAQDTGRALILLSSWAFCQYMMWISPS